MSEPTFHVRYRTWLALARDCEQQIRMQGLMLACEVQIEQFEAVVVEIVAPDDEPFSLAGEVIQVIPGHGVAVQFKPDSPDLGRLIDRAQSGGPDPSDGAEGPDPEVRCQGQEEEPESAPGDAALPKQIEDMTVGEKRSAALHGRKSMRMLLIRDRNKTIHPFVVKNPAITLDEIQQIAKMPSVNPDVLRMIATNREWVRSAAVCRNLVRNPKTPMREALQLLAKLPQNELRALAKSNNVRTAIQQAALKKVVG